MGSLYGALATQKPPEVSKAPEGLSPDLAHAMLGGFKEEGVGHLVPGPSNKQKGVLDSTEDSEA